MKEVKFKHKVYGVAVNGQVTFDNESIAVNIDGIGEFQGKLERVVVYGIRQLLSDSIAGKVKKGASKDTIVNALRENFPQRLSGEVRRTSPATRYKDALAKAKELLEQGKTKEAMEILQSI